MAKVELKKPIVEEIAENVKGADSVILVNYLGINVAGDTALRKELREAGVVYKVSDIPSREVLLGRLFGSMQSPVANFARVIKQIAEKDGGEAQA